MNKKVLSVVAAALVWLLAGEASALVALLDEALNVTVPCIEVSAPQETQDGPQFEAILEFVSGQPGPSDLTWVLQAFEQAAAADMRDAPTVAQSGDLTIPYIDVGGQGWEVILGLAEDNASVPPGGSWRLNQVFQVAQSNEPRDAAGGAATGAAATLAAGINGFALDLYNELRRYQAFREGEENFLYSPFSVSQVLAMVYAGARTATEQQMADVLRYGLSQEELHPAFNALDMELAGRGAGQAGTSPVSGLPFFTNGFRLTVVNGVWAVQDNPLLALFRQSFRPEFLDVLAESYGDGIRFLDFYLGTETARTEINRWMNFKTKNKIAGFIPSGGLSQDTRLLLTNAVYFNASWEFPFDRVETDYADFHALDGTSSLVDMMSQQNEFGYTEGEGFQAVELPYAGGELSMLLLLPASGGFRTFEDSLDADFLVTVVSGLAVRPVKLKMPRWTDASGFDLAEVLKLMGMTDLFSASADLSGMDNSRNLAVSDIVHRAYIAVDESGTEAAAGAATSVQALDVAEMTVDRPFVYVIRDVPTGVILFAGRVVDL